MDAKLKPLMDWRQRRAVHTEHTREIVRDVRSEHIAMIVEKIDAQDREIARLRALLCALAEEAQNDRTEVA